MSSGGLERSRPGIRSMASTIPRVTTRPDQPGSGCTPARRRAGEGSTSPISQRRRFRSFHCSVEPAGTVLGVLIGASLPPLFITIGFVKPIVKEAPYVKSGGEVPIDLGVVAPPHGATGH